MTENATERTLRHAEVLAFSGLSRSHIHTLIKEGRFPKPIPLSDKSIGWLESELINWRNERIAARDRGERPSVNHGPQARGAGKKKRK